MADEIINESQINGLPQIPINRIAATLKRKPQHVSLARQAALAVWKPVNLQGETLEQCTSWFGRDAYFRRYQHKRRTPKSKRVAGRMRPR